MGDRDGTEVLSGLDEGDLVVISGQFLIDSESQLNEAILKMMARQSGALTPAPSSMEPSSSAAWSCPMHPEIMQSDPGRCSICGMFLEQHVPGGHGQ